MTRADGFGRRDVNTQLGKEALIMTDELVSIHLKYDPIYHNNLRVKIGYHTGLPDQNFTLSYPQSELTLEAVARVIMETCLRQLQHPHEHDEPVFTPDEVLAAEKERERAKAMKIASVQKAAESDGKRGNGQDQTEAKLPFEV
jgi:hypothetical protein